MGACTHSNISLQVLVAKIRLTITVRCFAGSVYIWAGWPYGVLLPIQKFRTRINLNSHDLHLCRHQLYHYKQAPS